MPALNPLSANVNDAGHFETFLSFVCPLSLTFSMIYSLIRVAFCVHFPLISSQFCSWPDVRATSQKSVNFFLSLDCLLSGLSGNYVDEFFFVFVFSPITSCRMSISVSISMLFICQSSAFLLPLFFFFFKY